MLELDTATTGGPQDSAIETSGHPDMVWVPGGTYGMGSDKHYAEEAPVHRVTVDGFWIDRTPVTTRQFSQFVRATGYATYAEVAPDPKDYPGALPHMLKAGSLIFTPPKYLTDLSDWSQWWTFTFGANWKKPHGPGSSISGLMDNPVIHVAYRDALAYAKWAGKDLPSEAEWEFAARGGLDCAEFAWGSELAPARCQMANTWQGAFPRRECGYRRSAVVPNKPEVLLRPRDRHADSPGYSRPLRHQPRVSARTNHWSIPIHWLSCRGCRSRYTSYDRCPPHIRIPRKVLKGGSHLCAANYCRRYRPASHHPQPVDTSTSRCIVRQAGAAS